MPPTPAGAIEEQRETALPASPGGGAAPRRFFSDLRFAARVLGRNLPFTLTAALSLAIGIGAVTAIFTIVKAVFLEPPPVHGPGRLKALFTTDPLNPGLHMNSYMNYRDLRQRNRVFSGVAIYVPVEMHLAEGPEPREIAGQLVSAGYFDVLGVKPVLGRTFRPEEEEYAADAQPVAVLSHALWTQQFRADPAVVGRGIRVNGRSFRVVGVAPPEFKGLYAIGSPGLWVPSMAYQYVLPRPDWFKARRVLMLSMVARLKPGVTDRDVEEDLEAVSGALERLAPRENRGRRLWAAPLAEAAIEPSQRPGAVRAGAMMMTATGFLLLIACANVANLLLVRAAARRKEMAIRLSLGAGPATLLRQLLTESLLLALVGGAAGLLLAMWGRDLLWSFRPPFMRAEDLDLSLDGGVLAFTAGVTLAATALFGLVPALEVFRRDFSAELKEYGTRGAGGRRSRGIRSALVVGQVALSLIALAGAGLFWKSLRNAELTDPGFEKRNLVVARLDAGAQGFDPARGRQFYDRAVERVASLPGVESASICSRHPLTYGGFRRTTYLPRGSEGCEFEVQPGGAPASGPPPGQGVFTTVDIASPRYFETAGIPILRGRGFTPADSKDAPMVVIVSETLARQFWPGEEAIGKRLRFWGDRGCHEVVGIARDSNLAGLAAKPEPVAFVPASQSYHSSVTLYVRTRGDPAALVAPVKAAIQGLVPTLPLPWLGTIEGEIARSLWAPRMGAALLGLFGLLGLALSAVGLYGVTAYLVSQRTHEIGIRMAMGAAPGGVLKLILREGMMLLVPGLVIGVFAAHALAGAVSSLLYGVKAADPSIYALAAAILTLTSLAAGFLPAWRAVHMPPYEALRRD